MKKSLVRYLKNNFVTVIYIKLVVRFSEKIYNSLISISSNVQKQVKLHLIDKFVIIIIITINDEQF